MKRRVNQEARARAAVLVRAHRAVTAGNARLAADSLHAVRRLREVLEAEAALGSEAAGRALAGLTEFAVTDVAAVRVAADWARDAGRGSADWVVNHLDEHLACERTIRENILVFNHVYAG